MNKILAKAVVFLLSLIPGLLLLWNFHKDALGPNPVENITHSTGDWTIRFLLITLSITPLRRLLNQPALIGFRRMLGLLAFFYGCLHLTTYLWLDQSFDWSGIWKDIYKRPYITAGFTGWALMVPLALTSTAWSIRKLGGKRWQQLHRLIYFSALAGVVHYYWLVKSDVRLPLLYGTILLVLPNAWDAGSARLIESCGAAAIATTSSGVAWAHGYPDGDKLPPRILAAAVAEITRVLSVPLTVDVEGGYSTDPQSVGEMVAAVIDAGAAGINLEDGTGSADLLCAKIGAARTAAAKRSVDLFINARTDVYLKGLVTPERAVAETLARAQRYQAAGCDGLFVPGLTDPAAIRSIATAIALPLNVMVRPTLPPVAELRQLGVRRVSAGSAIAQAAHAISQRAATQMLGEGRYDAMFESSLSYADLNALYSPARNS